MKRLAIVSTHPIQYNAPLFQLLTERQNIDLKIFYTWGATVLEKKYDPGFGKVINWDIPLLNVYEYEFLENTAADKGSHHFKGIINPGAITVINKYNPDAILIYGWSFQSHFKIMRYFKNKIPVFFRGDSTLLDEISFFQSLKRNLFLRWVYAYVDVALYVGKSNKAYFKKAGLKGKQLVFAPHAIDNKRFACESENCKTEAKSFRTQLKIETNDLVFLYAGKLEPVKNIELLLKAFSQSNFEQNVHIVIVGNGPLEKKLKKDFNLVNIHFLDFQNQLQMPSVYELADVFILPSKSETWGLSVNEAMANGKAIIVSDKCGCAADLLQEGINGYVFETGNLEALQTVLRHIVNNPKTIKNMQHKSKEIIKEYCLTQVALAIEKIVKKVNNKN